MGDEQVHPETRAAWRAWLEANHASSTGVWVVQWKSSTGRAGPSYDDLVEEALCFGWIDSQAKSLDAERSMLRMTPRKPGGGWARTNKVRVERLLAEGRMAPAGQAAIDVAKANGAWTLLDDVEAGIEPDDLTAALDAQPDARRHFDGFPPSAKKQILYWIKTAKKPETRAKRLAETVRLAAQNKRSRA